MRAARICWRDHLGGRPALEQRLVAVMAPVGLDEDVVDLFIRREGQGLKEGRLPAEAIKDGAFGRAVDFGQASPVGLNWG